MQRHISLAVLFFSVMISSYGMAQTPDYSQLDPKPYDPKTEPNIDMYMGHWKESMPRHSHGSLIERDILTRCDGDHLNPPRKGAVLKYMKRFVYATLESHTSTTPFTPEGEQEIFYILSGKGTVTGGGETHEFQQDFTFLIPENMEFTMKNTGDEPLNMYLLVEPTYMDFRPNDRIVLHDETKTRIHTTTAHWVNNNKYLIETKEGLADIELLLTVYIMPNTFAQPHSHGEGVEEVWCTIDGDVKFLLGKQIRNMPPGTAYMIPPDGKTPHANFNVSDTPVKIFYFARGWRKRPR